MTIPTDKAYHFLAGAVISMVCAIVGQFIGGNAYQCAAFGFLVSMTAGLLKEIVWDELLKWGYADWRDMVATGIGGLVASIIWWGCAR